MMKFSIILIPVLVLMVRPAFAMPYIPTDEIASEASDPQIIEELGAKRMLAVRSLVNDYYHEFAAIPSLSNPEMSSFCPKFSGLSEGRKIFLFSFILDMYIHGLPIKKKLEVPVPERMSPKQLEALRLERGDHVPLSGRKELYELLSRFDEAQVDIKAREMLQLFQRGPVSPADLHSLLMPNGIKRTDPSVFLKWIFSNLGYCGANP
jgi:hypothetical protein